MPRADSPVQILALDIRLTVPQAPSKCDIRRQIDWRTVCQKRLRPGRCRAMAPKSANGPVAGAGANNDLESEKRLSG